MTKTACARAYANIALVKYWGKRDVALNLPTTGSIALTLHPLATITEVTLDPGGTMDRVELDGTMAEADTTARVHAVADWFRSRARSDAAVRVRTRNTFPTGAGLASSASAFAALVHACDQVFETGLSVEELSAAARFGSGSAARSIFGGFTEMFAGSRSDGTDAHARQLFDPDHWPLRVVLAVVHEGPKEVGSRDGMELTRATSPYFPAWIEAIPGDLDKARRAIAERDLGALAEVAERNTLRMHAAALAAAPGILYFRGATVELIHAVRTWRRQGLPAFFTVDAGPNVKVFCQADDVEAVAERVRQVPGVTRVIMCKPGPGAHAVTCFGNPERLA